MMSPTEVDRFMAYGLLAFLAGGICWLCGLAVSMGMLIGLGAMSGSFNDWRTERGLWMLGALFLFIFGGFYVIAVYHQFADWFAGRAPLRGMMALDWFIATLALGYKVRFLWAVTYWNRRVSSSA